MDSIKKSFALCPKALKLFYILAGVQVVTNLINLIAAPGPDTAEMTLGRSLLVILLTAVIFLIAIFVQGGALVFVKDLIKNGTADIKGLIDNCKKYFLKLVGLTLLLMVAGIVIVLLANLVLSILPGILKVLVGIVLGLVFMVFLVMPAYALVGSDMKVIDAIKSGVLMAKKNFVQVLALLAILIGVGIVAFLAASLVSGLLSIILQPLAKFITAILIGIVNAAVTIVANIAFMDFYLKKQQQT